MGLSKQEFIKRMSFFDKSGLTVSAFCKQYQISESRFYQYRKQQRKSMQSSKFEQEHFEIISVSHQSESNATKAVMVKTVFDMDVVEGHLFLFRSRCGSKLKGLYYEEQSFTLFYRRLEKGKFIFPRNQNGNIEVTKDYLTWLLSSNKYTFHQGEKPAIYKDFF